MEPSGDALSVTGIDTTATIDQEEDTLFSRIVDTLPSDIIEKLVEHVIHRNPRTLFPVLYVVHVCDLSNNVNAHAAENDSGTMVCWSVRDCLDQIARMESAPVRCAMRPPIPFGLTLDDMTTEIFLAAVMKEETESPLHEDIHVQSAFATFAATHEQDYTSCEEVLSSLPPFTRSHLYHMAKNNAVPSAPSWTTCMIGSNAWPIPIAPYMRFVRNHGVGFREMNAVMTPEGANPLIASAMGVMGSTRTEDQCAYVSLMQKWLRAWEPVEQAVSAEIARMQAPGSPAACLLAVDDASANEKRLDAYAKFIETMAFANDDTRNKFHIACVGRSANGCKVRYAQYTICRTQTHVPYSL